MVQDLSLVFRNNGISQVQKEKLEKVQRMQDDERIREECEEQMRYRDAMSLVIPASKETDILVCCKICGLIKDSKQFEAIGCENCNKVLSDYDSKELVTKSYSGYVDESRNKTNAQHARTVKTRQKLYWRGKENDRLLSRILC